MTAPQEDIPTATVAELDEAQLVEALRAGEQQAYERLVREHGGRMLAVAMRLLGDDADANDALQDAFISAFKAIDRFEGDSKLSTWLHRITVNAALMKLRSQKRRRERNIDDLLPVFDERGHHARRPRAWGAPSDELMQREEIRQMVRQRIDELPNDHREVLLLRDIEQLNTAEAAEVLGITTAAVKTRLHRARLALRALLEGELA